MKTISRHAFCVILLSCITSVPVMANATMDGLFENVSLCGEGDISEARASAKAHANSTGENLGYHSTEEELKSFKSSYTPPEFPEGMRGSYVYGVALFSDDGCELKIDGHTVHNRYQKGQALPKLSQSFHDLPVLLSPGEPVEIELKYSNTWFITDGRRPDIDGVTIYLYKVRAGIIPDYNRDGVINDEDRGKVTKANPWRWWVNDDDDSGEINEGKGAGNDIPGNASPDHADMQVDGMRDLVDFFPLQLDLSEVVERHSPDSYKYLIKHSTGGIKFHEVVDAQPNVHGGAAKFLRDLGAGRSLANAQLKAAEPEGANVSNAMLEAIERGQGLLLLEGAATGSEPIELKVLDQDENSVLTLKFPVLLSPVETMYRHANMRRQVGAGELGALPTQLGDPGEPYPDELTSEKYFVFVHGYNVDSDAARGWHAEIFKRMHQMGSRARFIGLSWHGDTGLNYHKAVQHAFVTSKRLKEWFRVSGEISIAAHSLGNMVVSNAIEHEGFRPARYYMVNAATPIEAYDPEQIEGDDGREMYEPMTPVSWKSYLPYRKRLFASDWYSLFPQTDGRNQLTWNGLFSKVVPGIAYNYYSTGEDVVANPRPNESVGAHLWGAISNWDFASFAWVSQEIAKGSDDLEIGLKGTHAGWKFNKAWETRFAIVKKGPDGQIQINPDEIEEKVDEDAVKLEPFHEPFVHHELYDPMLGSDKALEDFDAPKLGVQHELLGTAIPAMSFAAAANKIQSLDDELVGAVKNFNMMGMKNQEAWPRADGKWLHSDFRNVSLGYVWPLFENMIIRGELDE